VTDKTRKDIILIGGGGHCKSVIDVINEGYDFRVAGILDIPEKIGQQVLGITIIGSDRDISPILERYSLFHISVGHILSNEARVRLYTQFKSVGALFPSIIAKDAHVSKYATLGDGCFVGHNVVVNAGAVIGENSIINTGAVIEHDSVIGSHTHISTMCTVNADCKIGDHSFLSSQVVVNRGLEIADNIIVYSGSVITKSFFEKGISLKGTPAKRIE
jgi:sugar O-acyltransferase (sialic acid O-acetyltransferase NeuD family)